MAIRHLVNNIRTWYKFHFRFPWVRYSGFVRVMHDVVFVQGMNASLGNNVQFGPYCLITTHIRVGNNVLFSQNVAVLGRNDHTYDIPKRTIWEGNRGDNKITVIEDDVWIGHGSIIMSGITIGRGSIVAAGSVVTKDIPPCEIWGGILQKK